MKSTRVTQYSDDRGGSGWLSGVSFWRHAGCRKWKSVSLWFMFFTFSGPSNFVRSFLLAQKSKMNFLPTPMPLVLSLDVGCLSYNMPRDQLNGPCTGKIQVVFIWTSELGRARNPRTCLWQMCKNVMFSNSFAWFLQVVVHDASIILGWFFLTSWFFHWQICKFIAFPKIFKVLLDSCI